jgi:hypothetical protein
MPTVADHIADQIRALGPRLATGTLRLFGEWYSHPGDVNWRPTAVDSAGLELTIWWNNHSVLRVWNPDDAFVDEHTFAIARASRVRLEFYESAGDMERRQPRRFVDYQVVDGELRRESSAVDLPLNESTHFPAVVLVDNAQLEQERRPDPATFEIAGQLNRTIPRGALVGMAVFGEELSRALGRGSFWSGSFGGSFLSISLSDFETSRSHPEVLLVRYPRRISMTGGTIQIAEASWVSWQGYRHEPDEPAGNPMYREYHSLDRAVRARGEVPGLPADTELLLGAPAVVLRWST